MDTKKLEIFVLGHTDTQINNVPTLEYLTPVNIATLPLGKYQTDYICEHRIYLTNLPENSRAEYVGFLSHRYESKYNNALRFSQLHELIFEPSILYVAHLDPFWVRTTFHHHPGIEKYLKEFCELNSLHINNKPSFWSNNFICHKDIYVQWQAFFRKNLLYFSDKYGFGNFDYPIRTEDLNRHDGAFYERMSMIYFTNQDIEMRDLRNDIYRR